MPATDHPGQLGPRNQVESEPMGRALMLLLVLAALGGCSQFRQGVYPPTPTPNGPAAQANPCLGPGCSRGP